MKVILKIVTDAYKWRQICSDLYTVFKITKISLAMKLQFFSTGKRPNKYQLLVNVLQFIRAQRCLY